MPPSPPRSQRSTPRWWARCCGWLRLRALIALEDDPERRQELVQRLASPASPQPRSERSESDLDGVDPQLREPSSPSRGRIIALAVVTLGAAVVVGGWLGSLSTSGSEIATGLEGATDTTPTNAGPAEDQARQLRVVMGWLGLDDVVIAVRGETIEISGEVPTSLDRNSVFEVASELPDGVEVDLDRLVVAAPVEVARPPLPPGAPAPPTPEAVEALQRDLDAAFASDPVWFEPGTIMLDDQQLEFLAKDVVDLLARGRLPVTIVVAGDREAVDGDGAANLRVERATYVRDFLIARGLPPLAVQIASSAPDSSVEDRDRPAGPERGGQVTLDVLELPPGPGPGLPPGGDRAPATDSG